MTFCSFVSASDKTTEPHLENNKIEEEDTDL